MTEQEPVSPTVPEAALRDTPPGVQAPHKRHASFWIRELPFTIVLILNLLYILRRLDALILRECALVTLPTRVS